MPCVLLSRTLARRMHLSTLNVPSVLLLVKLGRSTEQLSQRPYGWESHMSPSCPDIHCECSEGLPRNTGPGCSLPLPGLPAFRWGFPEHQQWQLAQFSAPAAALTWQLCAASEREPGAQLFSLSRALFSQSSPSRPPGAKRLSSAELSFLEFAHTRRTRLRGDGGGNHLI